MFGAKCDKCLRPFDKHEFVMRAKSKIFHTECFRCSACGRQLMQGDEYALKGDGGILCRDCNKGSGNGGGLRDRRSSASPPRMAASPREENNNKDDDLDSRFDSKSAEDEEDGDEDDFKTDDGFDESKMSDGGESASILQSNFFPQLVGHREFLPDCKTHGDLLEGRTRPG